MQRFDEWDFRAYMEKKKKAEAMRKDFFRRQAEVCSQENKAPLLFPATVYDTLTWRSKLSWAYLVRTWLLELENCDMHTWTCLMTALLRLSSLSWVDVVMQHPHSCCSLLLKHPPCSACTGEGGVT